MEPRPDAAKQAKVWMSTQANDGEARGHRVALLSLLALGVVYGDIGTSPLYALRECFHGSYGIAATPDNVLGVMSLVFWALLVIVTVKYLTFILRADNQGEGGVLALTALVTRITEGRSSRRWALVGVGLFAATLLYGDGMITPAISVLSAVEGIRLITPALDTYVVPATVAILIGLFLLQSRGTGGVGLLFGPVTLAWFAAIAAFGVRGILLYPGVLAAVNPWHGLAFVVHNGLHGFIVLGAVFLVVTGAEALYADLGHFGRRPIRLAWAAVVLPALLCNYFGQAALLIRRPGDTHHPFFALVPEPLLIPMVILATAATIIASQAMISGAFSLTRQAIQLGYLPRLRIVHTSETEIGQIYMPQVNWILMICTVLLVLGFRSSGHLAAAYGVAVTTTMLITTLLFFAVARARWQWSLVRAGSVALVFLVLDVAFFGANIIKIFHGAWFPLVVGAVIFLFLTTWKRGRELLAEKMFTGLPTLEEFIKQLEAHPPTRVPGQAVFLAGKPDVVPPALLHNLKHNHVLHSAVAVLTIATEDVPRVAPKHRVSVTPLGSGFYRLEARYGFMEQPNVPQLLAQAAEHGLEFQLYRVSFFVGRERVLPDRRPHWSLWSHRLFAFMTRNAQDATTYFQIPPSQVVELGARVQI
jgi:KUP system potassium uptake protein